MMCRRHSRNIFFCPSAIGTAADASIPQNDGGARGSGSECQGSAVVDWRMLWVGMELSITGYASNTENLFRRFAYSSAIFCWKLLWNKWSSCSPYIDGIFLNKWSSCPPYQWNIPQSSSRIPIDHLLYTYIIFLIKIKIIGFSLSNIIILHPPEATLLNWLNPSTAKSLKLTYTNSFSHPELSIRNSLPQKNCFRVLNCAIWITHV